MTYRGHTDDVITTAWSPDSQRLASGGFDTTVQVRNATNGSDVYTFLRHTDAIEIVAWAPDGLRIASGS
jgi:WD40 repeat protein